MKMQREIRWRKMWAFLPAECLHRIPCLFHVWTIRRVHVRHTGDNGRTFRCRKGHTQKSYKLSSGMRTWPAECSKLGKTRIIEDANIRLVRNAIFFDPNFQLHFHMKSPSVFPVILLIKPKHGMLRATPPLFLSLYNVFLLCVIHPRRLLMCDKEVIEV